MDRIELLGRFARTATGAIVFLLLGLGMVAGGVAALVAYLPDGDRELRVYEAAARCVSAPPEPTEPADCLWTWPFTVSEVDPSPIKRGESPSTVVKTADGDAWEVEFANGDPVLKALEPGDRVSVTVWRGLPTEISAHGASQRTAHAPADMRARTAVLAMILLPSGLTLAVVCCWRLLRRRPSRAMTPGQRATFALSLGFLMTAMLAPIPATLIQYEDEAEHALFTAAIWLPIATVMVIAARIYTVRKRHHRAARTGRNDRVVGMADRETSS